MDKWFRSLVVLCALCFVAIGLWFMKQSDSFKHNDSRLMVNGNAAKEVVVKIHSLNDEVWAEIPFIATLETLGYSPEWINQDTASFEIFDHTYFLSLPEKTFYREDEGPNINLLLPPPGSNRFFCERVENELVVDNQTLWSALYLSEIVVRIKINAQEKIVCLNQQ